MEIHFFIDKLLFFKRNRKLQLSKDEANWLSKIFQYYENLNRNEKLFIKYLNVKIQQIPSSLLNYLNYSSIDRLIYDLKHSISPFLNDLTLDDMNEGRKVTSEIISAVVDNFNIQKGMYDVHNRLYNYVIKAEVNSNAELYSNKWIVENKEIEYVLEQTKINSGSIKNSRINNSIKKSINNNIKNNFYLFVRDSSKNEKLYTFKGAFKALSLNLNSKSIRLIKKEAIDIQDDLRSSVEGIIDESTKNPFYEKFKLVEQKQRIGQKLFRELLLFKYSNMKCAICDVNSPEHLIANHIKPFSDCNLDEAVDPNNGLLLCPDHNHLMDKGYLTFNEEGKIMLSIKLPQELISEFRLNGFLDNKYSFDKNTHKYIKYHNEKVFLK